jgi:hypothetical protein
MNQEVMLSGFLYDFKEGRRASGRDITSKDVIIARLRKATRVVNL